MAAEIKKAAAAGKGVFAMKIFGGGNLIGHYLEAIRYVRDLEGISSLMIGFGSPMRSTGYWKLWTALSIRAIHRICRIKR